MVETARPGAANWLVTRRRLDEQLDDVFGRRLAVVTAGAGFGKSTLVAAWATDVESVWYSLEAEDGDLDVFARRLAGAVRRRVRGFPADPAVPWSEGTAQQGIRADALAGWLCSALQARIAHDLVLVLDDIHELERASSSARFVESLVRQAPSNVHIVLLSRLEVPFRIDRLRGRGEVVEISAPALAFTRNELEQLVEHELREDDASVIDALQAVTDGWPAAVRLALEAVRHVGPEQRRELLARLRRPQGPLFDYLAYEVFEREEPDVQQLLSVVAPFERFTIGLCEALGVRGAGTALASLARRGLFLRALDEQGDWFALHSLLREFALTRVDPPRVSELRCRAGQWFETHGLLADALTAYVAAEAHTDVARLLDRHGIVLNDRGHGAQIARALGSLPPHLVRGRVLEVRAMIELGRGHTDEALASLERASSGSQELRASQARLFAYVQRSRGRHDLALSALMRAKFDGSEPRDEALVVGYRARSHYVLGQQDECRRCAAEAQERANALDDPHALAIAYVALSLAASLDGDVNAEDAYLLRAADFAADAGHVHIAAGIQLNRAALQQRLGRYEDAFATAHRALALTELSGENAARAGALVACGEASTGLGRFVEASNDLEEATSLHASIGTFTALGDLHRTRGDRTLAERALEHAVELAERGGHANELIHALAGLARTVAASEPHKARELAERALALGAGPDHGEALLAAGWIALAAGDRSGAAGRARATLTEARTREWWPLLAEALELEAAASPDEQLRVDRLEEARMRWRQLRSPVGVARVELALARWSRDDGLVAERAERQLRRLGVDVAAGAPLGLLSFAPDRSARPSVRCLGRFEVVVKTGPVLWKSNKARDLLKILISRRGVPVPRDELMDFLWPGDDPARASNRLAVALSALRTTLDPARDASSGQFVSVETGAVRFQPESLPVDVEAFMREAQTGLALVREGRTVEAVEVLLDAESLYGGDFLPEDAYADWAVSLREEARSIYVSITRELARHATAERRFGDAALYHLRILSRDPYDEHAHLDRVRALGADRRHGEARRAYGLYVARMKEIHVEPVPFPDHPEPARLSRV